MGLTPVSFKQVYEWDSQDIIALYRSAGWWEDYYDSEGIQPLIRGSFIFVVGVNEETGRAIAMGRILSDRVKTGYIQDLCVLHEMRGMHIGSRLLEFLIQAGLNAHLSSLHLIAEPDTQSFYEKFGFICEKGLIFLMKESGEKYEN